MSNDQIIINNLSKVYDNGFNALNNDLLKLVSKKKIMLIEDVCESHGRVAIQHHDKLVHKFIEHPADTGMHTNQVDLTASGPPLPVLLKGLKKLCDMRSAAKHTDGFNTRYNDIESLRACLK